LKTVRFAVLEIPETRTDSAIPQCCTGLSILQNCQASILPLFYIAGEAEKTPLLTPVTGKILQTA
jgi:hypothetical protein